MVNAEGRVECEIHGTQIKINGSSRICAVIEPLDHEYFSHLQQDRPTLIWSGSAQETGHKIRRAAQMVALINENPLPYNLVFRNCNTILKSMLKVMDLKSPDPEGWTPGYRQYYGSLVAKVRQDVTIQTDGQHDHAAWLDNFLKEIRRAGETLKERMKDFKFA